MYENEDTSARVEPEYVSLQSLADLLDVSVSSIHRLRRRGVLPKHLFIRFGLRLVRVDMSAFREWLADWDGVLPPAPPRRTPQAPPAPDAPQGDGGPGMKLLRQKSLMGDRVSPDSPPR